MKARSFALMAAFVAMIMMSACERPITTANGPQLSKQDTAYIFTSDSNWVQTTDTGNIQDMFCERRIGFGPAVKIKISRSGVLREVYRKYYTKWDTVTYNPLDSLMNLQIRARQVEAGEYWVIAAADTYLDNELIRIEYDGDHYYGTPTLNEIQEPAWKPKKYLETFTSLTQLEKFAKQNNCWLVICSRQTMDLLGWRYEPKECYQLKIHGKTLPVLNLISWGNEEAEWEGVHIKYRYLCIGMGGRDVSWGPGVSAFNNNNPDNIEDNDFVVIDCKTGDGYYFDEKVKNFSLKNFDGI